MVDPSDPIVAEVTANQIQAAARTLGLELHVLNASSQSDFDAVFSKVRQLRASGLAISTRTAVFASRNAQPADAASVTDC
jgi:putative tryptophan/tyrosine transport system substrate-binding protein